VTVCRQCGARNPDDFDYCGSCGSPLRDSTESEPTIIDVSDDEAEVVIHSGGRTRSFQETYVGPARIYVTGGGSRSCLIIVVIAILLACCVCVGWWTVADNIFF
jgi:hypothetical protein